MPEKKTTHFLYGGEVQIEVIERETYHLYRLAGEKTNLISVTACTGVINKADFLVPWAVGLARTHLFQFLEQSTGPFSAEELLPVIEEACKKHSEKKKEAADIGSQVHAYAESLALAQIAGQEAPSLPEDVDERVTAGINAFLNWFVSNHVKFVHAENVIYSKRHGYAGKFDSIAEVNGKKVLIDYKTSKGIYSEMQYQVAAYRMAYEEEYGKLDGAIILHFDKETGNCTPKEISEDNYPKDASAFLACLQLKKREKELAKA